MFRRLFLILLAGSFALPCVRAEVVRIEVKSRADLLEGKSFGTIGAYERVSGKIYFAVDPRNSANRIVTDIDKAPKNAAGKVEFSSDFYMLKPKDLGRGNGTVLYEVSNRGNKGMLGFFNLAAGSLDPQTAAELGDGFLLEQGFTLLWAGWQFDVANRDGLVRAYVPTAREPDGRPVQGLVRSDFSATQKTSEMSLPDTTYTVLDPKDPANVLTVRDSVEGARRTVPRDQWEFTDGVEPPPSAYPRIGNGTLVPADKLKFPKIPNLTVPGAANVHEAYRVEYGPDFVTKGIISQEPPKVKSAFPMLVPQADADGNDVAGIRMPEIAVPLATYLGWNFFNDRSGPTSELASLTGSMIPFARTRAERERTKDPRPSIEERYRNRDQYLELIAKSANELAAKGYLMKEDIPRVVQQAASRWDWVMGVMGNTH
jgi:hypothetical protein